MLIQNSRKHIAQIILRVDNLGDRHIQTKFTSSQTIWIWLFGWFLIIGTEVNAQITTDGTVGTEVNTTDNVTEITGGTRADSNLFHSFQDFSVQTGNTAFFNNAGDISNIVGRVTGANISNIDGLIRANGSANLILINPNGILFGANAQLDIGGSFLGSTADSVVFADGTNFSASNADINPILTVSVPVGLQLGQNSGGINVTGNGHDLSVADPLFSPIIFGEQTGLRVRSGQTLALVGSGITFDGGTVAAPGGKVELGSVAEGLVNLDFADGWSLGYENITAFENIQLRSQSLADVSGTETIAAGSIKVQGKQLSLNDGSLLLVQNIAQQEAGNISVNTSESVTVNGTNQDSTIRSSITNETLGIGEGGDVEITTSQLSVEQGATVVAKTLSPISAATGGNLEINASESVNVVGSSDINPNVTSSIVVASFGAGNSGNSNITTNSLSGDRGGTIVATVFDTGDGGDLSISANSIELKDVGFEISNPSGISASTFGEGNAGNLTIDTSTLTLLQGGRVDASTAASGNAGSVTVNASDSITISGTEANSLSPSSIVASADIFPTNLRELFRLPDVPSGNSGSITLTTPQLEIDAGGQITVRNQGTGNAGIIDIETNNIFLNSGGITAATQVGESGDINLGVRDTISLVGNSQISSDNYGAGAGGTINFETNNLEISDRSYISTTTFGTADGGNVNIEANKIDITGAGFVEFQEIFQSGAIRGNLTPADLPTGITVGTVATGKGGNVNIDTETLSLSEGVAIFSPVFTEGSGGNVDITADNVEINASAIQMGIVGTSELQSAGDLNLNTERLTIRDGGTIFNTTIGNGSAGNINIAATESIEIKDTPIEAITLTGIYTNTFGEGLGGNINISTARLEIIEGLISSNTGGVLSNNTIIDNGGDGGNINIQVDDIIEVGGIPDNPAFTSGIGTSAYSDSDAGDLTISTSKLVIQDGADFATATLGAGKGGQLIINATDSVELIGRSIADGTNRGGLLATSGRLEFPDLEATGVSGDIRITTPELRVRDGASIDVQSLGIADAGSLNIDADTILLNNRASLSASTQSGVGGDIQITTNNLELNQSLINASVLGEGTGGNIQISARDSVKVVGSGFEFLQNTFFAPTVLTPEFLASLDFSLLREGILAATIGSGQAGTINIETNNLEISQGGLVATATTGSGSANSIFLNAAESMKIDASIISASTVSSGQGGNIIVDTNRLQVFGGGQLTTSTLGTGNGGNVTVNATESVTVSGKSFNNTLPSSIIAGALPLETATGNGGNLIITTSELNINDGGEISVGSVGTGDAGTLNVDADLISLDRQGVIFADTQSGEGGNIVLNADNIFGRGNSSASARAEGTGNGGNISIDANNLALLEDSQINANATEGTGGNIQINTQGLFICQECQITASSRRGIDGVVNIETIQPNTQLEVLDIPQQPTQAQETVAVACPGNTQAGTSELTIIGRGGLPPRPQEPLSSPSFITFDSAQAERSPDSTVTSKPLLPPPARSWYVDAQGTVVLSAKASNTVVNNSPQTTPNCQRN